MPDGSAGSPGTDLIARVTLEELLGWRDRALALSQEATDAYRRFLAAVKEAAEVAKRAAPGHMAFYKLADHIKDRHGDPDKLRGMIRADLDASMWRHLLTVTGIGGIMDKEAHSDFERELASNPPEVTAENVRATFAAMKADAAAIFRRGVVNVFKNLAREYRSHDGFKIGHRIIMTYVFSEYGSLSERYGLADADRIMHVLDGHRIGEGWYSPLIARLEKSAHGSFSTGLQPGTLTTEYWHIKWFKNRNAHLYPLRKDLLRRVNRLIAQHYEDALGAGPDAAGARRYHRAKPHQHEVEDFYRSPPDVAARIIAAANLRAPGVESVLEPSAGDGAIVEGIMREGINPDAVEVNPDRADLLRDMLPPGCVIEMDFLAMHPEPEYDRVLANFPFGKQADVQHAFHALRFLKPGGRLVAVMGPGLEYRSDGPTEELRKLVRSWGGRIEKLPPGSFKASGTMTDAVLVVLDKPAAALPALPAPEPATGTLI